MKSKQSKIILLIFVFFMPLIAAEAQQLNSVPLNHEAYTLIEMGVMRGAISPPSAVKPWSQIIIKQKLSAMLNSYPQKFSARELDIINNVLKSFIKIKGLSPADGKYYAESAVGSHKFTIDAGINWGSDFSLRLPEPAIATVNKGAFNLAGDMSAYLSWNFNIGCGFLQIDREELGQGPDPASAQVYSIPAYFPYTFTKPWEAGVFSPDNLGAYAAWPDTFSFFYEMLGEINTGFFDNRLYLRMGRMRRDWGPEENSSSLFLNASARPFTAFEGTAIPLNWLKFSFLTGSLEYLNNGSQEANAEPYQNMLSMALLEIDTGSFFHLDFGSSAVYAKRPELGYFFPLSSNFFNQNNGGNFDNVAVFADLEFRFSRMKLWGSLFIDKISAQSENFFFDKQNMYAYQAGVKSAVGWLPFGAFTLRYTKIEPYCYTHNNIQTPWRSLPADISYITNGENIGSYLPPNSDELQIKLETIPLPGLRANIQYQLIRHGVDWGYRRVPGSSVYDKIENDENTEKYFLKDGAYQWNHVIKLGAEYSMKTRNIPVSFFVETGIVFTRFTNSDAYIGEEGNYSKIDNADYRAGTYNILSTGFRIFP